MDLAPLEPDWNHSFSNITPEGARQLLQKIAYVNQKAEQAFTKSRLVCGQLLLYIQQEALWSAMGSNSWSEFLDEVAIPITGLRRSVLYNCMRIASSPRLAALEDDELKDVVFSQAVEFAKFEAARPDDLQAMLDIKYGDDVVELIKNKGAWSTGSQSGGTVRVWFRQPEAAEPMTRAFRKLSDVSPSAAEALAIFLETEELWRICGGADGVVDLIVGECTQTLVNSSEER